MPEQKTSKQKTSKQKENHCSLKCSINKSSTNFGPERSRVRPNLESTMLASIDFDISTFLQPSLGVHMPEEKQEKPRTVRVLYGVP